MSGHTYKKNRKSLVYTNYGVTRGWPPQTAGSPSLNGMMGLPPRYPGYDNAMACPCFRKLLSDAKDMLKALSVILN